MVVRSRASNLLVWPGSLSSACLLIMPDDSTNETTKTSNARRLFSSALVTLLVVALVWFVTRRLGANFDEVSERLVEASRPQLVIAFLAAAAGMTFIAVGWTDFLRRAGHTAGIPTIVGWYFVGEITKYLPGGLWAFVGRGELAAGEIGRRPAYRTVTHSLLVFFALAALPSSAAVMLYVDWPLSLRVLAAIGLLAVYPAFVLMFGVTGRSLVVSTLTYGTAWLMIGLTTDIIASAIGADIGLGQAILITAAAWIVGFGVFFVPGGIGIRESTFVFLTTDTLDQNDALAIAIIARIAFILADVAGAAVGAIAQRRRR